jgi:hypothetical protein
MIQPSRAQDVKLRSAGSSLGIATAKHQTLDATQHRRTYAHNTGFKSDVQGRCSKPPTAEVPGGLAQGQDLGVRCRIGQRLALIATASDDRAMHHHDCTHWYIRGVERQLRFAQCFTHALFMSQ